MGKKKKYQNEGTEQFLENSHSSPTNSPSASIFSRFDIEFDAGPEPLFHGGELITGSLKVNLKRKITISSIRLRFKGLTRCLIASDINNESAGISEVNNEKVYFDKELVMLERPPGYYESGHFPWSAEFTYSLPFECPLPKGCEISCENPWGYVRYFALAILSTDENIPTRYFVKKAFSVLSSPRSNAITQHESRPILKRDTFRFGGCCCRGLLSAEVYLPKCSYAPGENVIGTITVKNQNARNIFDRVEVRFIDRIQRLLDGRTLDILSSSTPSNGMLLSQHKEKLEGEEQKKQHSELKCVRKKRRVVKKTRLTMAHSSTSVAFLSHRVIELRKLNKDDLLDKRSIPVTHDVLFLTIPPVPPTTVLTDNVEVDPVPKPLIEDGRLSAAEQNHQGSTSDLQLQFSQLVRSPSMASNYNGRQQKPLFRISYALQVSLGSELLIELPIEVLPIPFYEKGVVFRPFGAGPQPIVDNGEADMCAFPSQPFTFQPLYPVYLESPTPLPTFSSSKSVSHAGIEDSQKTEFANDENILKNLTIEDEFLQPGQELKISMCQKQLDKTKDEDANENLLPKREMVVHDERTEHPDGSGHETVTRTYERITSPDGHEIIHQREERVTVIEEYAEEAMADRSESNATSSLQNDDSVPNQQINGICFERKKGQNSTDLTNDCYNDKILPNEEMANIGDQQTIFPNDDSTLENPECLSNHGDTSPSLRVTPEKMESSLTADLEGSNGTSVVNGHSHSAV